MKYYLIDTSAYIYAVIQIGKSAELKHDFFVEKAAGNAFLYMPQFCIAEVLNTFARFLFRDKKIGAELYNKWRNHFIDQIHNRKVIYAYDLHRYHILNADAIYRAEQKTRISKKEKYMSTFDILIIAMAIELKKIHANDQVILLTRDGRLRRIGKMFVDTRWFQ
jgi:hypothetical protein